MKPDHFSKDRAGANFQNTRMEFQKWALLFQRIGLSPRRFTRAPDAVYMGTSEGWFRVGFNKYSRHELNWVHRLLEYMEERSFQSWAVPWQKTIIWEEDNTCYLIQPWEMEGKFFQTADPGSLHRIVEIMANFYRCGKDYVESKGIEIVPERWRNIEVEWESGLRKLDKLKIEDFPEKSHGDLDELRKNARVLLKDNLNSWRNSGINSLLEHQQRTGILGHGRLLAQNIIWLNNDYRFLNWEYIAFQPRITDLATLIMDVAYWEPEWILYLISEYARIQPFWPEEYLALEALLRYPEAALAVLESSDYDPSDCDPSDCYPHEVNRKSVKVATKELARQERCLDKVRRELGPEQRWAGNFLDNSVSAGLPKLPTALAPLETWGDFSGVAEAVISDSDPSDCDPSDYNSSERLTDFDRNRIGSGKDCSINKDIAVLSREREVKQFRIENPVTAEPEADQPPGYHEISDADHDPADYDRSDHDPSDYDPGDSGPADCKPAVKKEPEGVIRWAGFPKSVAKHEDKHYI